MYTRLSVLMFLQYAVPGAWIPIFSLRLQELGFTPMEMACAYTGYGCGAVLASLLVGQIADRWLASERCIAIGGAVAGVLLWLLADLREPLPIVLTCIAFWTVMAPTLTLGVSLSFTHLAQPDKQFGPVRMWGTIGWVIVGLLLGYWLAFPGRAHHELADSQRFGALLAWLLAIYALTLPHTPPARSGRHWLAPLGALALLRQRRVAVIFACSVLYYLSQPFVSQLAPLLMKRLGLPDAWASSVLTLGQSTEIVTLAVLPLILARLGLRTTILVGQLTWLFGMAALMVGTPLWLVILALPCNGVCVCCFVVAMQIFVHQQAEGDIRASAQGLMTMLNGVGLIAGNLLVGVVRTFTPEMFAPTFAVAVGICAVIVVLFSIGFREEVLPQADRSAVGEPPDDRQAVSLGKTTASC